MKREKLTKVIIKVRVVPRSSRNQVVGREEGVYRIKLVAPPVDGKANEGLKRFLSTTLGLPKGSVAIISGERSRFKSLQIEGLSLEDIHNRLKGGP